MPQDLLQREQDAFDASLADMLGEHEGAFVIFKDEHPVAFYDTLDQAYAEALHRFGLESVFLISQVVPRRPASVSLSWDLGVMYAD
jgi:hypothetical protein